MDFENKYPYTDFNELNLDWILKQMKALAAAWDAYQEALTGTNGAWPTFKSYIENEWATYQANLTGPTGEWPTFKAAMELAWQQYQDSLTGIGGEWPTFKNTMEAEWQQFFDTYMQTLGVVQTTGISETDVISQKTTTQLIDSLKGKNVVYDKGHSTGYYIYDGGTDTYNLNTNLPTASYVILDATYAKKVKYNILTTLPSPNAIFAGFELENGLCTFPLTTAGVHELDVPEDCKYIYLCFYGNTYITSYTIEYAELAEKAVVTSIDDQLNGLRSLNEFNENDPDILIGKYLDNTGSVVVNANFDETGFIPCQIGDKFTMSANGAYLSSTRVICMYDENKVFISGVNKNMPTFTITADCSYFRILYRTTEMASLMIVKNDSTLYSYQPYYITEGFIPTTKERLDDLENKQWDNANGVAFGTSLTYRSQTTGGYLNYLPDLSGMTWDNQGVGSSKIYGSDPDSILNKIIGYADYANVKAVIIEGFVNDWYGSAPLGQYNDTTNASVCGCLHLAIEHIKTQNPYAKIFVILDHVGQGITAADVVIGSYTQYEYYEVIRKCAEYHATKVIKEYADSDISEYTPQYLLDNIHCNMLGAEQSAKY
ncbi:MAG: SGNH/GDSL hydrolase family protein, partial [Methanobrevibacter sp.]|nr:SGNH/GDSL hydrolase family protein [Methanobrevibacter sp.]